MRNVSQLILLFLNLHANSSGKITLAFVSPSTITISKRSPITSPIGSNILNVRGGDDTLTTSSTSLNGVSMACTTTAITSAVQSGPLGIIALSSIAASAVVPLTMYRQGYSFSVGYGLSVFAMGLAVSSIFSVPLLSLSPLSLLSSAVMFYGARLAAFLLIREWTVPSKKEAMDSFDKSPRLKRIPLAISVSVFYAFLTSPLMYAARAGATATTGILSKIGIIAAWTGAVIEAVADTQKFIIKRGKDKNEQFIGPTNGVYKLCRHPNYFGEVLYWFGLLLAGLPSFGKNYPAYLYAGLGFYGIVFIMTGATKRLVGKQKERYGGQEDYEEYVKQVPASIWPCTSS
mmetsp:Transcript_22177/g.28482  ORF Transcript_22177/g.28482 Transcript_22177/m.28482 type:complete len:345 (+) Transcript_22177:110-1144(+)